MIRYFCFVTVILVKTFNVLINFSHPFTVSCSSGVLTGTLATHTKVSLATINITSFEYPATFFSKDEKKQYSAIYH